MNTITQNVVSISQYGADMARGGVYSGALARQRDYARLVLSYVVFVPGKESSTSLKEGNLEIRSVGTLNSLMFAYRAYSDVVRYAATHPVDVLMVDNPHLAGIVGVLLRYRLKKPLIVHSMGDMLGNRWYRRERPINHLKHLIMRLVFRLCDAYRVSTVAEVERLVALGYERGKIVNVPFYVDHEKFIRAIAASTEQRDPYRALYVGRLGVQKDVPTLIRAFWYAHQKHKQAKLVIVGSGPTKGECQSLVRSLGLKEAVVFRGSIPYDDVAEEFVAASVFVLSSLYEGTCMVLHEAAAARLPIIATDTAGARDLIGTTEAGWIVPVRSRDAFGEALCAVFDDPQTAHARGEIAFQRLGAYTKDASLRAFTELLTVGIRRHGCEAGQGILIK